ncbi:MAG: hypothetical protein QOC56_2875 [Alphaproteobacteria bacterium]|nr:hypothetical protein [Alphaproteobacteria bacterium]
MQTTYGLPTLSTPHDAVPIRKTADEALIGAIAKGDKHAMELLFSRHNVRVYRFIRSIVGDVSLAEDIVSEVFLDVWRSAGSYQARSQVSTWLLAIARHKALTAARRHKEGQLDDDVAETIADSADSPETAAHRTTRAMLVRKCLVRLPASQREILDLVYYQEKSVAEVAQIVGIPQGTVKTRMFYARSRIAALLKEVGIHDACVD